MRNIVVLAHDIRSIHNVGSLFRTCEGLGVSKLYLTGYTPYPKHSQDKRLPHLSDKINQQIHKTALGAETAIPWEYQENAPDVLAKLKSRGFTVAALEQTERSMPLADFLPPEKVALMIGNEVSGLDASLLSKAEVCLEIPMFGQKESFNVTQAAAMALYQLRFIAK